MCIRDRDINAEGDAVFGGNYLVSQAWAVGCSWLTEWVVLIKQHVCLFQVKLSGLHSSLVNSQREHSFPSSERNSSPDAIALGHTQQRSARWWTFHYSWTSFLGRGPRCVSALETHGVKPRLASGAPLEGSAITMVRGCRRGSCGVQ